MYVIINNIECIFYVYKVYINISYLMSTFGTLFFLNIIFDLHTHTNTHKHIYVFLVHWFYFCIEFLYMIVTKFVNSYCLCCYQFHSIANEAIVIILGHVLLCSQVWLSLQCIYRERNHWVRAHTSKVYSIVTHCHPAVSISNPIAV